MRSLIKRLRSISPTAVIFPLFFMLFCLFASVPNARAEFINFELDYADGWHPAPSEIIGIQTDTVQIHFIGDIVTLFFSRSDDILVENLTTNTQYAGDDFFDGCEYYPMTPLLEGEISEDCDVHEVIGDTGSPRIDLFVDSSIWSEFSDGDVIQITLLDQTSTPTPVTRLIARLNADLFFLVQSVDVLYTFQTADGISPYFIGNFDLDGTETDIAPYGYSSPVQFFAPHGKISGTLSEIPGYANMVVEPEWPEDLQLIGTPEEGTGHIIFDIFSDIGFEIDTPYYFGFMSDGSPYLQFHPELPPTQDLSGEFLVCGPDCSDSAKTTDASGVEFQFRTSKVRIDNFPFQGYTLKMDPTSLPLSMEVAGRRKGEVNEVYLEVSEDSLGALSTDLDTSSSFVRDNTEFLPEDLATLATTEVQLSAYAYEGATVEAGFDYVTYTYEPVTNEQALYLTRLNPTSETTAEVCIIYNGAETVGIEDFHFYVQQERDPEAAPEYDANHPECTLTAQFIPQGLVEKLFAVAIVSEEDKIAYISNRITITEYDPLNLPGENFFADLDGDHAQTGLDIILINNYALNEGTSFPYVMPHNGDSGAISACSPCLNDTRSSCWPIYYNCDYYNYVYSADDKAFECLILSQLTTYNNGHGYSTSSFSNDSRLLDRDNQTILDNSLVFANIGGIVATAKVRIFDAHHTDDVPPVDDPRYPRSGLGINFTWTGPITLLNAFRKEIPSSGVVFDPARDDTNANGFQDCCYASDDPEDMNCTEPATNCALGVTWEIGNAPDYFGYAVGSDPEKLPQIQNQVTDGNEHTVMLETWLPQGTAVLPSTDATKTFSFKIRVPKPEVTMVGTKSVEPGITEIFNGVEQHVIGEFPPDEGPPELPTVGDNQIVEMEISSSLEDCFCFTETYAAMDGATFEADVDFSELCSIPSVVMDCDFQIAATGYDSQDFPSLQSDTIEIHINPRDTAIPPHIIFPVDEGEYSAATWSQDTHGDAPAWTSINIYDGCPETPDCSEPPYGDNCDGYLLYDTIAFMNGTWTMWETPELEHTFQAMSYDEAREYCRVSEPVSFFKDTIPPVVTVSSPDPWPVFVLTSWIDQDSIPESTDTHFGMTRLHRLLPSESHFEIEGEVYDANMATYEIKLVNQMPGSTEEFKFDGCYDGQYFENCRLPQNLHTSTGEDVTSESALQDKFFRLVIHADDLYNPPVELEIPLIITRDPLVEITLNQIEPSYPQDYIGMNGSDATPLKACTGLKINPLEEPNYTQYNLEVPESGFDIDFWLSEAFINFMDAGLMEVRDAPGGVGVTPITGDSFNFYVNVPVTVTKYDGESSTEEFEIPALTDWSSNYEHSMPFYDKITQNGVLRYNGTRANYPIVDVDDITDFPVAHFQEPAVGEVMTVTAEASIVFLVEGGAYNYVLSPYHFDIGNWAVPTPDNVSNERENPNETWDDYMPFDRTQIIFLCLDADRTAAFNLIGRDIARDLNGDTIIEPVDGIPEDIFYTNPYFDVCNPDTYCEYPDYNQPDPIAGYKCETSEWGSNPTDSHTPDGTFHKYLRIVGINSDLGDSPNTLVPESNLPGAPMVTLNKRVRYMVGESSRDLDYSRFGMSFNESTQEPVLDYQTLNVREIFTYDQLLDELETAELPTTSFQAGTGGSPDITRRNYYSIWLYPGQEIALGINPSYLQWGTEPMIVNNRDLAANVPKKDNVCRREGQPDIHMGAPVNYYNVLFNQQLVYSMGLFTRVNHCKIIPTESGCSLLQVNLTDCSEQVLEQNIHCYTCDRFSGGAFDSFRPYDCFGRLQTDTEEGIGVPIGEDANDATILSPSYSVPDCNSQSLTDTQKRYCHLIQVISSMGLVGGAHEWGHKFGMTVSGPPPCGAFGCNTDGDYPLPPDVDPNNCLQPPGKPNPWPVSIHDRSPRGGYAYYSWAMGESVPNPPAHRPIEGFYQPLERAYVKHRVIFDDHDCPDRYYKFWNFTDPDDRIDRQLTPAFGGFYNWSTSDNLRENDIWNCIPNPATIP